MKNVDIEALIDKAMTGRLSPEERARWDALLAERPDLQENVALAEALRSLPAPPRVSTNFTALVLQEINRPETVARENPWLAWLRWRGFARLGGAAAIIAAGFVVLQHQRQQQMERSVEAFANVVSSVATKPEPDAVVSVLKDFEAIRQLPESAPVDYGLLAALRSN